MSRQQRRAQAAADVALILNHALALHQTGRLSDAEPLYRAILKAQPAHFDALHLLGVIHEQRGEHIAALRTIEAALRVDPRSALAHANRGVALKSLGRLAEAQASYERAIALKPDHAEAHNNLGVVLAELRHFDDALASYSRAIALRPDYADALHNRGAVLQDLGRLDEALADYDRAIALNPAMHYVRGNRLFIRMNFCDWRGLAEEFARIEQGLAHGARTSPPFPLLATPAGPQRQRQCAEQYIADRHPPAEVPLWRGERYACDRIRVAYLSADLHDHATAHLAAGLFEAHDRTRFEIVAVSSGHNDGSAMRRRLERAFDRFIDVRNQSDREVAQIVRAAEIGIAVDLKGITRGARTGILAHRPAPIQVSYLGFPGTMGARYIDYIVADSFLVPPGDVGCYTEKVVTLPGSYQVNDSSRPIAAETPTRAAAGLPERGFVFCCFNNSYKITPDVFDVWMRLLRAIDGSALWLLESNAHAPGNLRREAELRGVAGDRLVFAPRIPPAAHLARHRLADLFLDTHHCNAHTTASDALWAGLPVLTCAGATFASRVAGSLLHAAGLPELVTHSLPEYEALALKLARDSAVLTGLRERLARNRNTCSLFDTARFARHIEAAYTLMWERYQQGEPPHHIAVVPDC